MPTEPEGTDREAEQVLRQTLRAMAGGPVDRAAPDATPIRPPRGSDRRWLVLIGVLALLTGMVLGVGSLWLF